MPWWSGIPPGWFASGRCDVKEVVLHIGLMKSGTTSVQQLLYAHASRLRSHGIDYLDVGQYNQMLCFVELLCQDTHATQRFPSGLVRHHSEVSAEVSGLWAKLGSAVETSPAERVLISAENLVYAGKATVDAIRDQFHSQKLHVVITHRPASLLVPSNFQQQARIASVGSFESWCRRELALLAKPQPEGSLASLRLSDLGALWRRRADKVTFVDTSGDHVETLPRMWEALTGLNAETAPVATAASNRGMAAEFVAALQAFIASHPERSVAQLREIGRAGYRTYIDRVGRPHYQWVLESNLAEAVDRACLLVGDADSSPLSERLLRDQPLAELREVVRGGEFDRLRRSALRDIVAADRRLRPRRAYRAARARLRRLA